jgi:uncharacterized protein YdhG (YjbR/CyaY superfamily)
MVVDDGDRSKHFPAIERKHGGPISIWIDRLTELGELGEARYPEQIAYLRENHGFSQAHANALVMYVRKSPTSRRFRTPDEFFATLTSEAATTARSIFAVVQKAHPSLELVIAWNHPMLSVDGKYVLGLSVAKHHVLLNPFSADLIAAFADRLDGYRTNKKTFAVPLDWTIDEELLLDLVRARLEELFRPAPAPRSRTR